jgi:hypothetical protein
MPRSKRVEVAKDVLAAIGGIALAVGVATVGVKVGSALLNSQSGSSETVPKPKQQQLGHDQSGQMLETPAASEPPPPQPRRSPAPKQQQRDHQPNTGKQKANTIKSQPEKGSTPKRPRSHGHVFISFADLTTFECDAWAIPTKDISGKSGRPSSTPRLLIDVHQWHWNTQTCAM